MIDEKKLLDYMEERRKEMIPSSNGEHLVTIECVMCLINDFPKVKQSNDFGVELMKDLLNEHRNMKNEVIRCCQLADENNKHDNHDMCRMWGTRATAFRDCADIIKTIINRRYGKC